MDVKCIDATLKKKMQGPTERVGEGRMEKHTVQSADGGSLSANAGDRRGWGSSSLHVKVFRLNIAAGPARHLIDFDEMVLT